MSKKIIRFSRLLRIFNLNDNPAYIIELEENNQKNLYISYKKTNKAIRSFESYNESELKKEFKDLSNHCLMDGCTNATGMFEASPITHFEADCSSLVNGHIMFSFSSVRLIKTEFPALKIASSMFFYTQIKAITIDFPKIINGWSMFLDSSIECITSDFQSLENGDWMFKGTQLKEVNCRFPKLIESNGMFENTPPELKQKYPYYFT